MTSRWTALGAIALLATLAGCTAVSVAPTSPPMPKAITLTRSATLESPKGSKSAELRVVCTGTGLALTVGNEETRFAQCGTPRTMTVPVGPKLALNFDTPSGTTFTATVLFSRAAFRSDAQLTKQCHAASTALSAIVSAGNGVGEGAITQEQAEGFMARALAALQGVSTAGVVGQELGALRTWLMNNPTSDPRAVPGLGTGSGTINQLCADNESPVIIVSTYGG